MNEELTQEDIDLILNNEKFFEELKEEELKEIFNQIEILFKNEDDNGCINSY